MNNRMTLKILILCCLLVTWKCVIATSAQTRRSANQRSTEPGQMSKAKVAWSGFFAAFRKALRTHNLVVLKELMSGDFKQNGEVINRDEVIRSWSENDSWRDILKAEISKVFYEDGTIKRTGDFRFRHSDGSCVLSFEFRNDGKWSLTFWGCDGE